MDPTPFIIGSYAAFALVLAWCAVTPVLRIRRLRRELDERYQRQAAAGAR